MSKSKYTPEIGQKYNHWTVIDNKIHKRGTGRGDFWKVKCDCGKETIRTATLVAEGKTKSCKSCARTTTYRNTFSMGYYRRIQVRARKSKLKFELTPDLVYNLFLKQKRKCALSGVQIKFSNSWATLGNQTASLDRINSQLGYVEDNIQWVHKNINFMKGTLSEKDFIHMCTLVATTFRSSKCG